MFPRLRKNPRWCNLPKAECKIFEFVNYNCIYSDYNPLSKNNEMKEEKNEH